MQPSLPFSSSRSSSQQGVALIIVLAFLVLLSGLVLAFFARVQVERDVSNSSLNETKTDLLARSALDVIIGDLKQEIANDSDVATVGGVSIYQPKAAVNMLPVRSGTPALVGGTDPIPNLVRRSMRGATELSALTGSASSVSSTGTSANNRSIKLSSWNLHYLIPRSGTSATIDATPTDKFIPPDWVMVTANGPAVVTSPTNTVIGRYAYAIYNEGGLLDVNVAGYPSSLPAGEMPHPDPNPNPLVLTDWGYARKGGVAFADLTQLPTSGSSNLSQVEIDRLIGWRNYATAKPSGSLKSGYTFDAEAAAGFYDTVKSATNGFLSVATGTGGESQTNQMFTSRQAFLKFSRAVGLSQDVLQYFGTFSREKNAPSWSPLSNASDLGGKDDGIEIVNGTVLTDEYAYKKNKDATAAFNRRIANVRVVNAFTRLDGTIAAVGEPLIKQRFDLSRLSWIHYKGIPSGVSKADVMNYFGLTREDSTGAWIYNHGEPGNGTRINTLEEVAQQNREPDFFELLQAGILKGSMGLVSGNPADKTIVASGGEFYRAFNPDKGTSGNYGTNVLRTDVDGKVVSAQEKYQVIQIGANIIDQADEDSYPTEIRLNDQPFFGVENLPYINGMATTVLRPAVHEVTRGDGKELDQNDYLTVVHQWLTFSLWNPHRNAKVVAAQGPTMLRIAAVAGTVEPVVRNLASAAADIQVFNRKEGLSWIRFSLDDDYYNRFSEPTALNFDHTETSNANGRFKTKRNFSRAGIYLGSQTAVECKEKVPPCVDLNFSPPLKVKVVPEYRAAQRYLSPPPIFELQYLREGGSVGVEDDWRPYQIINSFLHGSDTAGDPYYEPGDSTWAQIDKTWGPNAPDIPNPDYPTKPDAPPMIKNPGNISQWKILTVDQDNCIYAILDPRSLRFNVTRWQGNNANNLKLGLSAIDGKSPSSPTVGPWFTGVTDFAYTVNNNATNNRYVNRDFVPRVGDLAGWFTAAADNPLTPGSLANRQVMLNRPFRNVGELGFVHRDDPWKTLNLISTNSADAALLDLFYVGSSGNGAPSAPSVVAGKVNINSASIPVLKALIANALRDYQPVPNKMLTTAGAANIISASDSQKIAADIATKIKATPLINLANIPSLFPQDVTKDANMYPGVKWQREALVRALADSVSTRTWNLLIDVIAQSGRYAPSAGTNDLNQFTVEGEKHYWLHVAIDRFTGEIVDQQLELVRE